MIVFAGRSLKFDSSQLNKTVFGKKLGRSFLKCADTIWSAYFEVFHHKILRKISLLHIKDWHINCEMKSNDARFLRICVILMNLDQAILRNNSRIKPLFSHTNKMTLTWYSLMVQVNWNKEKQPLFHHDYRFHMLHS